ncbi:TetR/AcrR family transcriptional regulator [Nonomuraea mesophila]|uniref:TetR/AcrR family transcriptional regulator n=1 Tax=Nonomuraea mesophila TaxID=2530382 RepID=A0A4R5FT98_9ACTN|nr:TetR/AcrR family transcriptional regulator [Nonomuraea mesophila]TDE56709.1 TetR/AcrR family transcriptional regulator [Nonomuraea mesophila]
MSDHRPRLSRAERRRQTENRILAAARRLFATLGYDRTTIRGVAAAAETDPGLVMRYFGSKDALFARVAEVAPDQPVAGTPEEVAELLLAAVAGKLESDAPGTLAMLRSMLTHPDAGDEVRAAIAEQQRQVSASLPTDDAVLRAGLVGALTIGVLLSRHLLQLEGVRDAGAAEIVSVLRPAVHAITQGAAEPDPRSPRRR